MLPTETMNGSSTLPWGRWLSGVFLWVISCSGRKTYCIISLFSLKLVNKLDILPQSDSCHHPSSHNFLWQMQGLPSPTGYHPSLWWAYSTVCCSLWWIRWCCLLGLSWFSLVPFHIPVSIHSIQAAGQAWMVLRKPIIQKGPNYNKTNNIGKCPNRKYRSLKR